jgi:lysine 6-dehydrogenase
MRALVLGGAGAVCKETTRDLAQFSEFESIAVADANLAAARALVDEIGDDRLRPIVFDADAKEAMAKCFAEYDIVINGLPFKYDLAVNQACVEAGVNGLDLSSDDQQFALHNLAAKKGMLFIPGVGATPGITNMMVARAAEWLDSLDAVEIYFAAFRCLAPAPGLLNTTLWEFTPGETARREAYFEDGEFHPTPPLSGGVDIRFHDQIGTQRVYYVPHDEAYSLPSSYPSLRRAAVRGCFPPQVMEIMGAFMRAGLLSQTPVQLDGSQVPSLEAVRQLLWANPISKENSVWAYGLVVEVEGVRNGRHAMASYRSHHPPQSEWGGPSAYFKNVGIPLSIGAQMMAAGQTRGSGVLPPEQALQTEPFFEALAERGIEVEEHLVEEGMVVK